MYQIRRSTYLNQVQQHSLSILFSGHAPQKSGDQNYMFSVNRNFFYLTGIEQERAILVLAKGIENTAAYLFIELTDPVKALWDGAGLSFEEAAKISKLELKDIRDIKTFDTFIAQQLSTSRRAQFGQIETIYMDLERQSEIADPTVSIQYALRLKDMFPFVNISGNQMILAQMRMIKDEHEIDEVRKAIEITKEGLNRILSTIKPGLGEYELEAEFNYVLNKHRTVTAFNTIAASGKNAAILHYIDNDTKINNHELVLFDLGVSYQNYNSDVTRTYPANGKFTDRQKAIYEVVLAANKKTIEWLKPGVSLQEFFDFGKAILAEGAKKLGLIKEDAEISKYYYHSLGHYLGLDVHDVGNYSLVIPEGALITVEPGLYIAEEGIGIRIEDDVVVTKNGCINLTKEIIKEVKDIESYMKK